MLLMEISLYTGIFVGMNLPWSLSIVPRQIRSFRRQRISLLIWCDTLTIMVMLKIMSQVLVKMERTGKVLLKVYLLTRCLFKLQYRKYLLLFAILNLLFRLKRMVGSGSWQLNRMQVLRKILVEYFRDRQRLLQIVTWIIVRSRWQMAIQIVTGIWHIISLIQFFIFTRRTPFHFKKLQQKVLVISCGKIVKKDGQSFMKHT